LLLAILLLQAGGMLLIYKIRQFYVQHEMMLLVKNNETSVEKLVLTSEEYKKSRLNSREISYKGNMYDVKSVNISGDTVKLLVFKDAKEKILINEIKDFLHKSNESKKELPDQLQKFLSINYLAGLQGRMIYIPSFCFNIYPHQDPDTYTDSSDIPSPPPKLG